MVRSLCIYPTAALLWPCCVRLADPIALFELKLYIDTLNSLMMKAMRMANGKLSILSKLQVWDAIGQWLSIYTVPLLPSLCISPSNSTTCWSINVETLSIRQSNEETKTSKSWVIIQFPFPLSLCPSLCEKFQRKIGIGKSQWFHVNDSIKTNGDKSQNCNIVLHSHRRKMSTN